MTTGAEHYPRWMQIGKSLRERLAWLLNAANSDDIALVKNTSEGLSFVAAGIDWQAGDQIIGIADDFPSNRIVWESLASQDVQFIQVDTNAATDPEQTLIDQITPSTRLMAISTVHFATGMRLDIARISQACRDNGVLLCLDAIQSLGAVRFDLQATPADFVVADGHKWLLGPEGLGVFYVNPAIRQQLKVTQFGWAMREKPGDYSPSPWRIAESARRFECGSPNMLGIHALDASLSLFQEIGFDAIEKALTEKLQWLRERLGDLPGVRIVTPSEPERRAGILSLDFGDAGEYLHAELMKRRIVCAHRAGFVRLSPHFYTRKQVLESACESIFEVYKGAQNAN